MGAYLRRAEDLGFESAMLIDHLLVAPPAYRTTWLEPVSLLSALAGVTRTIRLGTLVLVLPFRDPVAFAKEWATLDVLSGGRLDPRRRRRLARGRVRGAAHPVQGARPADERDARGDHRAVGRRPRHVRGPVLSVRGPVDRPEAGSSGRTRRSGSAAGPSRPRRSTASSVDTIRPVLRRIAKYAVDVGAALVGDGRDGRRRTGRSSARRWPGSGATPTR